MRTEERPKLRHAIIGVAAGVYSMHQPGLALETSEVIAVADINEELGQQRADELGCPFYSDHRQMLSEVRPDVTVILTPHPFHASMARAAMRLGSHVLVEKPMSLHAAEADEMITTAKETNRLLAVNFQQRFRPEVQAARKLIDEGALGEIQHVDMKVVWPRTTAYYRLGTWRGTWTGEGGGVLMNQAPHNLDLLCYLVGLPSRVVAWTRNLMHQIETEDTVNAMMEWSSGALGSLHISTAEAGVPERLEIAGTGGVLSIHQGRLEYRRFETELRYFVAHSERPFSAPKDELVSVPLQPGAGDHLAVYRDLHAAILEDSPLMADGEAGRMSLEFANAMVLSSFTGGVIELPIDRKQYARLLADLQKGATPAVAR